MELFLRRDFLNFAEIFGLCFLNALFLYLRVPPAVFIIGGCSRFAGPKIFIKM